MEESNTDRAVEISKRDSSWQRPANSVTFIAGMALQRPAKPIGSTRDGRVSAYSAIGAGAGARERVQYAIGSRGGRPVGGTGDGV